MSERIQLPRKRGWFAVMDRECAADERVALAIKSERAVDFGQGYAELCLDHRLVI